MNPNSEERQFLSVDETIELIEAINNIEEDEDEEVEVSEAIEFEF